jgi:hypothetical protein
MVPSDLRNAIPGWACAGRFRKFCAERPACESTEHDVAIVMNQETGWPQESGHDFRGCPWTAETVCPGQFRCDPPGCLDAEGRATGRPGMGMGMGAAMDRRGRSVCSLRTARRVVDVRQQPGLRPAMDQSATPMRLHGFTGAHLMSWKTCGAAALPGARADAIRRAFRSPGWRNWLAAPVPPFARRKRKGDCLRLSARPAAGASATHCARSIRCARCSEPGPGADQATRPPSSRSRTSRAASANRPYQPTWPSI